MSQCRCIERRSSAEWPGARLRCDLTRFKEAFARLDLGLEEPRLERSRLLAVDRA